MQTWTLPAAVAFVCWGIWAFLPKLTTRYMDPQSAIVYEALGGLLVALAVLALLAFRPAVEPRGVALALATGILGAGGALAYLFAVMRGPVTLIASATALYPILAVALATVFLHEPVSLRQALGVILGLIAIVLVTI